MRPKILIGTPIHEVKDYCLERWLQSVSQTEYPADLLLVDNSPGSDYIEKVKGYCTKYKLPPVVTKRFEINQDLSLDLKIEASQETIRQFVLSQGYDAWFSWECDQIIPPHALTKLVELMQAGNYMLVAHNSWARWDPTILNINMGCTLISRNCLEKCWFLPQKNGRISLDPSDSYDVNDPSVFKKRVLKSGGSYLDVYGIINPIYHLNE